MKDETKQHSVLEIVLRTFIGFIFVLVMGLIAMTVVYMSLMGVLPDVANYVASVYSAAGVTLESSMLSFYGLWFVPMLFFTLILALAEGYAFIWIGKRFWCWLSTRVSGILAWQEKRHVVSSKRKASREVKRNQRKEKKQRRRDKKADAKSGLGASDMKE